MTTKTIATKTIEVNEEGTEAAAATAVIMETTAFRVDVPAFVADHPFIFLLRDTESGFSIQTVPLALRGRRCRIAAASPSGPYFHSSHSASE